MYLKRIHLENNGPIKEIDLELPFTPDGAPKPLVLVGGNGSGKTNLLSIIADALSEAAATHFQDVVPGMSPMGHSWFRIVGGATISHGARGSVAILQFEHEGTSYIYKEKGGTLSAAEVSARLPETLRPAAAWPDNGSTKEFGIPDEQAGKIFDEGAYVYFPSSRAEIPHWMNRESVPLAEFDLAPRFSKRFRKPIYVEKSLERFQQWLLSIILESRHDITLTVVEGRPQFHLAGDVGLSLAAGTVLQFATQILRRILDDDSVRFAWLGRQHSNRLGIAAENLLKARVLEALSAGQSTLLGIFGTILRYADKGGASPAGEIIGICIVDEIDAHMHVDLQHRALPELIQLFPKVQFIVSSHSPLFVLGMEKTFGGDGIAIVDMPSGTPIQAEAYAEFARALEVLRDTKAFASAIEREAATPGKLLVLLEGETDPIYLQTAARLLERHAIIEKVEFAWVGAKDPKGGQSFHTGKDALNHTLAVLRAKPQLAKRRVVLLYDNDANKTDAEYAAIFVRSMPSNPKNTVVGVGIENLLPAAAITEEMFNTVTKKKRNGEKTIVTALDKMKLCKHLCEEKRDRSDFEGFAEVLNVVEALVESDQRHSGTAQSAGPGIHSPGVSG